MFSGIAYSSKEQFLNIDQFLTNILEMLTFHRKGKNIVYLIIQKSKMAPTTTLEVGWKQNVPFKS